MAARTALPPMAQLPEEWNGLLEELRRFDARWPLQRILEIGVSSGGTLWRLAQEFPDAVVVGVDPAPLLDVTLLPPNALVVAGSSRDRETRSAALELLGGPPDFVHVDGDHTLEGVIHDALWCVDLDVPLVAFHDVATLGHPEIEVFRAWDLIRAGDPDWTSEIIHREPGGYVYGFGVWRRRPR